VAIGRFPENLRKLGELGLAAINVKSEYGGSEAGVVAFSLAVTEIARACASTAVTMSVTNMVCEVIQAIGNEKQKGLTSPSLPRANTMPAALPLQRRRQGLTRQGCGLPPYLTVMSGS